MKKQSLWFLFASLILLAACSPEPSEVASLPTESESAAVETVDPEQVLALYTDPAKITANLTGILLDLDLPDAGVVVDDQQIQVSYSQPPALLPSEYREIFLLVFKLSERAAPFSNSIRLTVNIDAEPFYYLSAETDDVVGLRRGELSTNDFLDRLLIETPQG
jgi:hypothetical protein